MAEDFGDFGDETFLDRNEYLREVAELEAINYADDSNDEPVLEISWDDEDGQMSDVEADADTFASCGWGTDEDYGG